MALGTAGGIDGSVDELAVHRPGPPVASAVPLMTGYRQRGLAPGVHHGLPSPHLTLILTLDEPCHVAVHPDRTRPAAAFTTLVGGLHTRHAVVVHQGAQSGLQLALSPLGARAVLGLPAGALAGQDVPGAALDLPALTELQERLRLVRGWPRRFALAEGFLRTRLAEPPRRGGPPPEVVHAWRRIVRSVGGVPVGELAREVGYSPRRLRSLFDLEIGLSPKQAARVARFDATRRRLPAAAAAGRIGDLAAAAGYADQSHLNRDFRAFAGLAPTAWLAAEHG